MARSACAAFGGCCSARTSWFPCVLLCVLLGLVSLPCVGRLCAQLLCCLRSSEFRALSSSAGTLTAAGVRHRGGSMSLRASHCGCRDVPLSVGWYHGHRALLHMSPNLQTDLSLVFLDFLKERHRGMTTSPPFMYPHVWHSVWLLYFYRALDSHPFFPSHAASGCFFLSASCGQCSCWCRPHPPPCISYAKVPN